MKKVRLTQRITARESESFKRYLDDIRSIDKFTVDEEYETALIARNAATKMNNLELTQDERDEATKEWKKAIDELAKRNLRFVVTVAKGYVSQENSIEDLVNEGNYGLMEAAKRYDVTTGMKFITYAVWWIRRDIIAYINSNARIIRLPNNKLTLLSKLKKEVHIIEQALERRPSFNEILDFTKGEFSKKDVEFFLESEYENTYSFDKPVQDEDSQTLMSDLYEDDTFGATDKHLTESDTKYIVNTLLEKLKPKEREIIVALFGLDGSEPKTIKDIHEDLEISKERVRQIKEKSLKFMREYMH